MAEEAWWSQGERDPVRTALERRGCVEIKYVDDGVYVGYDGHQIWLVTDRGSLGGLQEIALDTYTYTGLTNYVEKLRREPNHHDSPKVG